MKERKLRQWCRDLEVTAINLEKWTQWIDDATANIMYLKRRKKCTRKESHIQNKNWIELKTCIDKDAMLWSNLCQKATRKLDRYKSILKDKVGWYCKYLPSFFAGSNQMVTKAQFVFSRPSPTFNNYYSH